MMNQNKTRALCMMSGGLDSILAARILLEQGVDVCALTFVTPFFTSEKGENAARQLNIPIRIVDITGDFLVMMKAPRYGFGSNMNPCIDCHTLMVRKAGEIMEKEGYDFVATGEVLGERPMSQNRQSLNNVARNSGYEDYLLRPLSALLMAPTKPEREDKIDRSRLFDISGRSRKPQIQLARKYSITHYPQPAGGCLLTVPLYSFRLKELFDHTPDPEIYELEILRVGRHFRLPSGRKVVVSRNELEGEQLLEMVRAQDTLVTLEPLKGPVAIIQNESIPADDELAASLCIFYSKYRGQVQQVRVIRNAITAVLQPPAMEQTTVQDYLVAPDQNES